MRRRRGGEAGPAEFERLYTARYAEIAGYVRRRVAEADADDVIAHVFTVAWRKFEQVPSPPDDRLWLFGVARNSVAEHDRSRQRRLRLHVRLAEDAVTAASRAGNSDPRYEPVLTAMSSLRPADREALQLVLWEELTHAEAASVLGCSVNAFELRYRRARNVVRDAVMTTTNQGSAPVTTFRTSSPARGNAS
ncbi:MAG TPA: sigma-70 family RNA polymerase sigma factor [Streptosporangiaceae bacterium]|nr:sigma-70 family RNA polymerase sigma factor [Streptosporangiaceae bacterium]